MDKKGLVVNELILKLDFGSFEENPIYMLNVLEHIITAIKQIAISEGKSDKISIPNMTKNSPVQLMVQSDAVPEFMCLINKFIDPTATNGYDTNVIDKFQEFVRGAGHSYDNIKFQAEGLEKGLTEISINSEYKNIFEKHLDYKEVMGEQGGLIKKVSTKSEDKITFNLFSPYIKHTITCRAQKNLFNASEIGSFLEKRVNVYGKLKIRKSQAFPCEIDVRSIEPIEFKNIDPKTFKGKILKSGSRLGDE